MSKISEKQQKIDAIVTQLIQKAQRKGALTPDEVASELVLGADATSEEVEKACEKITAQGIIIAAIREDYGEVCYIDTTKEYFNNIAKAPLLTREQEVELALKVRGGDERAKETLIKSNLRLVVSIAKNYVGKGVELDDLIQEGNLGLLKAVEKFDPDMGFRFSTYATWWIKQSVTRMLSEMAHAIHLPNYVLDQMQRIRQAMREQEKATGEKLSVAELAALLGVTEKKVTLYLTLLQKDRSMDEPLGDEGNNTVGSLIRDENALLPDEELEKAMLYEQIEQAINKLEPREIVIIKYRFGFTDGQTHTLEQTGTRFGLTRERVRQVEQSALRKLRQPGYNSGIVDAVNA